MILHFVGFAAFLGPAALPSARGLGRRVCGEEANDGGDGRGTRDVTWGEDRLVGRSRHFWDKVLGCTRQEDGLGELQSSLLFRLFVLSIKDQPDLTCVHSRAGPKMCSW